MSSEKTGSPVDASRGIGPGGPEDLVERLIRLADSGPELPADGADMVRAAIRPAWRAAVRARTLRRRLLWAGGGLAAAAAVMVAVSLGSLGERRHREMALTVATLAAVAGELEVSPASGPTLRLGAADLGRELVAGTSLATPPGARAAVTLDGGQSLRLDSGTSVRLVSAGVLVLDRGGAYVDSGARGAASLEVRTSIGVARDLGTQFEVRRSGQTLTVRVREGTVSLTRDHEQLEIRSGRQVTVTADGAPSANGVARFGPEWGWVQEVAPPFAIDGRSVVAFLAWVSRETGREVRFAAPEVESFAARTMLHGTLAGLGPGQAPEVILPGCGLEAEAVDGLLVVRQLQEKGGADER
jgi:hypothetical protein